MNGSRRFIVYSILILTIATNSRASKCISCICNEGYNQFIVNQNASYKSSVDSLRFLELKPFIPLLHSEYLTAKEIRKSLGYNKHSEKNELKSKKASIKSRNAIQIHSLTPNQRIFSWVFEEEYMSTVERKTDTSLWMNHLFYPQQRILETYTFLGNLGGPVKFDHYFSNNHFEPFLFNKYHGFYKITGFSQPHYNVKKPFTIIEYSTAGKRKTAEQVLKAIHTQNVNQYLNIGVAYNFYGTKGVYSHQETKNNSYSVFSSYVRGNLSLQGVFSNNVFKNEENGGIVADSLLLDEDTEPQVLAFNLTDANGTRSEYRERDISVLASYAILNYEDKKLDKEGIERKSYLPLLSFKLAAKGVRSTRTFVDLNPDTLFYSNFYINPNKSYDSVYHSTWDAALILELEQVKRYPGLPGFRIWFNNQQVSNRYYKPGDFVYNRNNTFLYTNYIGIAAFSSSNYISYKGAARIFFNGYKADDKDIRAEFSVSPWKKEGMPILTAKVNVQDKTPDIFLQNYFSNHYYWNNNFKKEKWLWLNASVKSSKLKTEAGYNLMHINNYIYFDTTALPAQTNQITITSLYAQNTLDLWRFKFVNRLVWQANSNNEVLSLPQIVYFTSFFYEGDIVKNALRAQLGASAYYRTLFYADAYNVATGQFYNQREKELGNYPMVDLFANLKWKRALLYFKYEHVNQRFPHSEYFSALHYPINPRIFKFGVSWIFYD